MDKRLALIGSMGLGAGLMFLLDPNLGRRRRHMIGDRARALAHDAEESIGKTSRHFRNHARGLVAEARARLHEEVVDDRTLVERVRAELGRATRYPRAIEVAAEAGIVILSGPVPPADRETVLRAAAAVRGVEEVVDALECHPGPDGHAEAAPPAPRPDGEGEPSPA